MNFVSLYMILSINRFAVSRSLSSEIKISESLNLPLLSNGLTSSRISHSVSFFCLHSSLSWFDVTEPMTSSWLSYESFIDSSNCFFFSSFFSSSFLTRSASFIFSSSLCYLFLTISSCLFFTSSSIWYSRSALISSAFFLSIASCYANFLALLLWSIAT